MILVGGIVAGLVGLGTGYLTLRLRGVFFAIATLALAVVVQTLIVNWDYVGGSRGTYVIRPAQAPLGGGYIQYLYTLMMALSVISVGIARTIERSRLGLGFAAIRDDEQAAEAGGVPTLRLKLIATTLSGGLMGMAGAPLPYYVTYVEPSSAFNLSYAVNSVAMPVVGGMTQLGRPDHRRGSARDDPAVRDGDDLVGAQPADRGFAADLLCRDRAERHCRPGDGPAAPTPDSGGNCRGAGAGRMSDTAGPAILTISGLGKRFGGFVALDNIDLSVASGERLGLIGPNGSGKSTLVNCLCGTLQNETGSVVFDGRPLDGLIAHERTRLGLARSFQLPKPFHTLDLVDNLRVPLLYTVNARHGHRRHHLSSAQVEERCHELLRQVSLAEKARRLPRDLTQVEMRKLELARAVATEPRLLFADEAMAGLSHAEIEDILAVLFRLNEQGITIVLIEHIMSAVMSISTRLVVLVAGQKIADGPPQEVVRNPEVERAYLGE